MIPGEGVDFKMKNSILLLSIIICLLCFQLPAFAETETLPNGNWTGFFNLTEGDVPELGDPIHPFGRVNLILSGGPNEYTMTMYLEWTGEGGYTVLEKFVIGRWEAVFDVTLDDEIYVVDGELMGDGSFLTYNDENLSGTLNLTEPDRTITFSVPCHWLTTQEVVGVWSGDVKITFPGMLTIRRGEFILLYTLDDEDNFTVEMTVNLMHELDDRELLDNLLAIPLKVSHRCGGLAMDGKQDEIIVSSEITWRNTVVYGTLTYEIESVEEGVENEILAIIEYEARKI